MKRLLTAVLPAIGMFLLILDPGTALTGASDGITLCIRSVIPSLFPFFILSGLLTDALNGTSIGPLRPIGRLCGIPKGAESLLLVGLLGGYPVGAQSVAQLHREGILGKKQAARLLGFCSNAGPAFLFGIVAAKFSRPWMGWALWGIHILSALTVGALLPGKESAVIRPIARNPTTLTAALQRSIRIMASVCGWVVVFRIILAFLNRWILWMLPNWCTAVLTGLLELTNGCFALELIADEKLRFICASAILAFGGLCVWMQTQSVTEDLGLGSYPKGKLLQTVISIFLSWFVMNPTVWPALSLAVIGIICRETKKRCSNPATVGV